MKLCNTCGMKLPDDSVFCTYCGASCEDAETYEENQENYQWENQVNGQENQQENYQWTNQINNQTDDILVVAPKKKLKGGIAIILGIVLVAIVVVAVFVIKGFKEHGDLNAKISQLSGLADSEEGEIVEFGDYYGNTEWIVLKKQGDILTLISKNCINEKPYNDEDENVTWGSCSLRQWLNKEYIDEAFDAMEQQLIEETRVVDVDGGQGTEDKIYILSYDESNRYFEYTEDRGTTYPDKSAAWWWLRSSGPSDASAGVWVNGEVDHASNYYLGGVRPVLNVNLGKIEKSDFESSMIDTNKEHRNVKTEIANIRRSEVGDIVEYGNYYGNTEWIILEKENDRALLLTKDAVIQRAYNEQQDESAITWEDCSIRKKLNDYYYNTAFNEEEREMIEETHLENTDNPESGMGGGADTDDFVFLLSIEEAEEYFKDEESRQVETTENGERWWWWLRTPGDSGFVAASVSASGSVDYDGNSVNSIYGFVRPAVWVNLD